VRVAQQELVRKGYSVGTSGVDGDFGPATYRATVAFQRDYALVAAGVIGSTTWGKLATGPSYDRGRGPNYTSRVVLTFDDCPRSASAFLSVVKAAKAADMGLVLAPTGNCLSSYKAKHIDLAALARSHGQYVINHSVSHPELTRIPYASVLTQLSAPGVVTNVGRPPYGATNATVAMAYTAKGMRQWTWTVDTRDWTGKTTAQVVSYVVRYSKAGSTVLMHMGWNGFTAGALAQMKSGLAGRGLRPCTAYHGTTPTRLPTTLPCAA
jgi:peptidoglycan/xylan/chitin deacetylase (PgdA/CDA1 family)